MNDAKLIFGVIGGSLLLLIVVALGMSRMTGDQVGGEVKEISGEKRLVMGVEDARVEVVEFSDFQCPACRAAQGLVKQVQNREGVRFVFRHMPLSSIHKNALIAAEAAEAAHDQGKFWEYHDLLLQRQDSFVLSPWVDVADELGLDTDVFSSCVENSETEELVVQGYFAAKTLELEEAPTYYINGQKFSGAQTYEELKQHIDEAFQEME